MQSESTPYQVHAVPDLVILLELYFTPGLTPFDIARRLNISLPELIVATRQADFQRLADDLKNLAEMRTRHLSSVTANAAVQAVADGIKAVQHDLARQNAPHAASDPASPTSHPEPRPEAPLSDSALPPPPPAHAPKPFDSRRALDSVVRALDKLHQFASPPPHKRRGLAA